MGNCTVNIILPTVKQIGSIRVPVYNASIKINEIKNTFSIIRFALRSQYQLPQHATLPEYSLDPKTYCTCIMRIGHDLHLPTVMCKNHRYALSLK